MKYIVFFTLLLLIGCTKYVEVERNVTIEVEKEVEVIKYINITVPCPNNTIIVKETNSSYVLSLLRQIRHCESREENYLNASEYESKWEDCEDDLDNYRDDYVECDDERDDCKADLDKCEDDLEDCEGE